MNNKSYPNQKKIIVHRDYPKSDFLQISNEHWMEINKKYGPYALQEYLYFSKNKDGYSFALSPEAAEKEAGIKRTTFYKFANLLIEEGYLVRKSGNTFDFYETPHKQVENEKMASPQSEFTNSQGKPENLFNEQLCSF